MIGNDNNNANNIIIEELKMKINKHLVVFIKY